MAAPVYIGDSLGVVTKKYLKGARSDARGGRPSPEGVSVLKRLIKPGTKQVYFDLGTNDGSRANLKQSLKQVRKIIGPDVQLYASTVNSPTDQKGKNSLLRKWERKGYLKLVPTARIPTAGDGIHLTTAGYKKKAKMINAALSDMATPAPRVEKDRQPRPGRADRVISGEDAAIVDALLNRRGSLLQQILDLRGSNG